VGPSGPDSSGAEPRRRFFLFAIPMEVVFAVAISVFAWYELAGVERLVVLLAVAVGTISGIAFVWLVLARLPTQGSGTYPPFVDPPAVRTAGGFRPRA
jgi:hypothetical protein